MLTVSTVNVNGLRAAAGKGYLQWLEDTAATVVCLQEVRAEPGQLTDAVREPEGWHAFYAPAAAKGRSGVAVLTRQRPEAHRIGFGSAEFAESGRYLEVDLPGLTIASLYLPSGETGTERQSEKERFMKEFLVYLMDLQFRAVAEGREVLVCGDWNIAHREIDLKNWRSNRNTAGFLPEERAWLTSVFDEAGYVDVVRRVHPDGPGPYSWWSYRGKAFDNDAGWRIDYHVSTRGLAERAVAARVERAARYEERWSDHAPVTVSYKDF